MSSEQSNSTQLGFGNSRVAGADISDHTEGIAVLPVRKGVMIYHKKKQKYASSLKAREAWTDRQWGKVFLNEYVAKMGRQWTEARRTGTTDDLVFLEVVIGVKC